MSTQTEHNGPQSEVAQQGDLKAAELLLSQQEVRRQRRVLQSVLDSMGEGVVVADEHGAFLLWNPAAARLIGIGPRQIELQEWSGLYGCYLPDGKTPYPSEDLPLARAIRGESVDACEIFLRNPDVPDGVWLSITARPLVSDSARGAAAWSSAVTSPP